MGQASRHQLIIPRVSDDETTFAVVQWEGTTPLLPALRKALADWFETDDGKDALENSSDDFNVGDLSQEDCRRKPLADFLAKQGIHGLDVEVYSGTDYDDDWTFDTVLTADNPEDA